MFPFKRITTVTMPDGRVVPLDPYVQKQLDDIRRTQMTFFITTLGLAAIAIVLISQTGRKK